MPKAPNTRWSQNFFHDPPAYHVGDEAKIIYDRLNPEHASIDSFTNLWMLPLFAAGAGGLFLLVSGILVLRRAFLGSRWGG
jgi:hypothetical protein